MKFTQIKRLTDLTVSKKSLTKVREASSIKIGLLLDINDDFIAIEKAAKGYNTPLRIHSKELVAAVVVSKGITLGRSTKVWVKELSIVLKWLEKETDNTIPKSLIVKSANAKQLSLLMYTYAVDSLLDHLINLTNEIGKEVARKLAKKDKDAYSVNKRIVRSITDNQVGTVLAINDLCDAKKLISGYDKVDALRVSEEAEEMLLSANPGLMNAPLSQVSVGFIGNPIYHIRKIFSDFSVHLTKLRIEKKNQLELLRLAVEAEAKGTPSANIERELESIDDRIRVLEYQISEATE